MQLPLLLGISCSHSHNYELYARIFRELGHPHFSKRSGSAGHVHTIRLQKSPHHFIKQVFGNAWCSERNIIYDFPRGRDRQQLFARDSAAIKHARQATYYCELK